MDKKEFSLFADSKCEIAENPLWNPHDEMLYWKGECLYRKSLEQKHEPSHFESFDLKCVGAIGGFAFTCDGALVIFAQHGRVWHWRPGAKPEKIAELPNATGNTYFNDVIADPLGRIYCGVLAENFMEPTKRGPNGSLWRLDPDCKLHCLEPATGQTPNGMGFSPDRKTFYFTDDGAIYRYDYDLNYGAIGNKRSLIPQSGCDGMTVDAEGCLWTAHWSNPLTRYSPEGRLLKEYTLPVKAISSAAFGGPDFKTIFVASADYPKGNDLSKGAGGVFRLRQEIRGNPEFPAKIR